MDEGMKALWTIRGQVRNSPTGWLWHEALKKERKKNRNRSRLKIQILR